MPIFALIIGNELYNGSKRFKPLFHAVNDADAIARFFTTSETLKASKLISMRNATRQQMLDGLAELEDITEGTQNACIIIFYAGHGGQSPRPDEWKEHTMDCEDIEFLCPSDIGVTTEYGNVVEGIPDRLFGAILSNLARKRGNNIVRRITLPICNALTPSILPQTVILDCCHSASMDRDEDVQKGSRCLENAPPVTAAANTIPRRMIAERIDANATRGVRLAAGFGSPSASSHVLLAACGRDGTAYENREAEHGSFTNALLKSFLSKKNLTMETPLSLMTTLDMPTW